MRAPVIKDISEIDLDALLTRLKKHKGVRSVASQLRRSSTLALSVAAVIGVTRVSAAAKELDSETMDKLASLQVVDDLSAFDPACLPGQGSGEDAIDHDHGGSMFAAHTGHGAAASYLDDPFASRFGNRYSREHEGHGEHAPQQHASHAEQHEGHAGTAAQHESHQSHQTHETHSGRAKADGHSAHGVADHSQHHDAGSAPGHSENHENTHAAAHASGHESGHPTGHEGAHEMQHTSGHAQPTAISDETVDAHESIHDHGPETVQEGVVAPTFKDESAPTQVEVLTEAGAEVHDHHEMTLAAMDQLPIDDIAAMNTPLI